MKNKRAVFLCGISLLLFGSDDTIDQSREGTLGESALALYIMNLRLGALCDKVYGSLERHKEDGSQVTISEADRLARELEEYKTTTGELFAVLEKMGREISVQLMSLNELDTKRKLAAKKLRKKTKGR